MCNIIAGNEDNYVACLLNNKVYSILVGFINQLLERIYTSSALKNKQNYMKYLNTL